MWSISTALSVLLDLRSELVEDLSELPGPGFAVNPFRGTHRTQCEPPARKGVVAKFDDVVRTAGPDNVLALGVPDTLGFDGHVDAGLNGVDNFFESNCGT